MANKFSTAKTLLAAVSAASVCSPSVALAADKPDRNDVIRDQVINFKDIPAMIKNPQFVTLKYDKADVREVLRDIAKSGGMNLILDDSVAGRVTIDVRAVSLDEFFSLVLRMNSLAARRVGTSLLIAKEAQLKEKIDTTQAVTLRLNNAVAEDVIKLLEKIVDPKDTKMVADPRTNSLLVTGNGEDIAKVRNAVKAIDVPAPQVVIEVKLVEMSTNAARQLGGEFGFGGSKFGVSNNVGDPNNITGTGSPSGGVPASGSGTSITFSAMGNITSNLNARITALVRNNQAKVLANPRIATQDSQEATIKIVNKIPVVQTNFQGGAGGAAIATENVEFKDIGETLKIKPRVDYNGFVTMDIEPVISVRGKDVIVNRNTVPEINERSLKTKMRVADGETVVIGGLIRRNTNESTTKMPFFGDIPVIGFMFKTQVTSFEESEVLIMVTPHIESGEKVTDDNY
ncbi:MAG: secretin N-terminal domain-containing protein [Candidatus Sericytochromatia bacterium]